jgi:hypothetical protein
MDLPKNERTFCFSVKGEVTQQSFDGEFTVICIPNMTQKRAIEIERSRLSADLSNPTANLFSLAMMLANLRVRILNAPGWWNDSNGGGNLKDDNVLLSLFEEVMRQEDAWREEVRKQASGGEDLGNPSRESK